MQPRADVILPVVIISVINIGINVPEKPTKFCIVSFVSFIISEKLLITKVTINMYCT